jgi:hypothetical protein
VSFLFKSPASNLWNIHSFDSSRAATLASRLIEPNARGSRNRGDDSEDEEEDAIFAELEEEIENDSNSSIREHALQLLKNE